MLGVIPSGCFIIAPFAPLSHLKHTPKCCIICVVYLFPQLFFQYSLLFARIDLFFIRVMHSISVVR